MAAEMKQLFSVPC